MPFISAYAAKTACSFNNINSEIWNANFIFEDTTIYAQIFKEQLSFWQYLVEEVLLTSVVQCLL